MKKIVPMSILWTIFLIHFYTSSAQTPQYCASKGSYPWEQWMERVSVSGGNFGNNSGKEGYGNFTSLTGATLQRNTGNLVTISPQSSWSGDPRNANMFWRVWVDFNGDGDFTDAGETVISRQVVIQSQTFLDNEAAFTPPSSARLGKTRLRVAMKVGGYPEPCETFERGEVEDYTVEIVDITDPNSCRYQDSLQLVNLYNATNGANWTNKWQLNTPIHTWWGLSLNENGCVTHVSLENNNLEGTLPNLNMPNLGVLNLRGNKLRGTIPNYNLPRLSWLMLASNQLSGSIPNFNLPNLDVLMLYSNQLTGTIPTFNLMPRLQVLLIDSNQLTGAIPNFDFPRMIHLALSYNQLTGVLPNFNFPVIERFFLDNNQLSGCVPASYKAFCGKDVSIANNPGLSTQDFTAFCSNNAGACGVLADLTLQNLTIQTPSPQGVPWTVQQGQVINFAFDIKNIGIGNATNNFTVKSYISKDNTLSADDIQNGIVPTGNFDAGFSVLQVPGAAIIPPDLAIGSYYLILKVDADNQIEESNENNNVLVLTTPFSVILGQTSNNYCASKGVAPWELWVSKVQFNTINNESEKFKDYATLGYSDYSNLSTSISKGQTYLLNVTPGLSWAGYLPNVYCRAWIDYNGNKVFENTELVFQNTNVNPFWANIRVPSSAINGNVRMRIALKWGGFPEPCEVFARGEVEDYTLNIVGQSFGSDTLRLVNVTGARAVRQGEEITLNISIKNTGTAPSSPNTPLSIYQNQQPFIFKGPPPTFLKLVSERQPIGRAIQPNEVVTISMTFKLIPNFSHLTRPDYSQVQYLSTYVVIGNRSDNFLFYPYSYPVLDTLTIPYGITAILDNADLAIQIIAPDTTFKKSGKHSFTVKVTNNGSAAAKDVIANVGTGYSQYASGIFTSPTVTPQRGTVFSNTPFGGTTVILWNISSLAPNESLTALVQYDKFGIPAILPEYTLELRVASNQIIDTITSNNAAHQRFVLDTTPPPYCAAKGISPWEQWISSVSVASRLFLRQYPATGKDGYGDFTALEPAKIVRGDGAFLTINPVSSWNNDPRNDFLFWRMWIDWNDDGDFDDNGELLYSNKVVHYLGQFFDNGGGFSVPAAAPLGRYRLRVAMKFGDYPSPCETFERGEVEDYTVNVVGSSSAPQPLVAQGNLRALVKDEKVRMDWVQQSADIAYFEVEKSLDGRNFQSITRLPAQYRAYHVAYDDAPTEGGSFYRLKMYLINGETRLSIPQKVDYEKLVDFNVFPNPAAEEAYIDLKKYDGRAVNIVLSDVAGHIIHNRIIEKAPSAPLRLDLTPFENGTYFIVIKSHNKRNVVRRVQVLR